MRRVGIAAVALVGLALVVIAISVALIESGEVVVIHTRDSSGDLRSARVWVVDHDARQWIAPGNRSNAWFQRLVADPRVDLVRSGVRSCHVATVVESPDSIPVLERFLAKYASVIRVTGLLNRLLEPAGDPSSPVAVRLDPCGSSGPGSDPPGLRGRPDASR
jgi:hypothetical protein